MSRVFHSLFILAFVASVGLFALGYAYADSLDAGPAVVAHVEPPPVARGVVPIAPTGPLSPQDVQSLVVVGLTFLAFCLRRFAPEVHWLRSSAALGAISLASALLTGVAGAILEHGLSVRVVCMGAAAFMTSALAQMAPAGVPSAKLEVPK